MPRGQPYRTDASGNIIPGGTHPIHGENHIGRVSFGTGSEGDLIQKADELERLELDRHAAGLGTLSGAYEDARAAFQDTVDPDVLFSRSMDQVGARGKQMLSNVRRSLGGRGLSPHSGAAHGALSRLIHEQTGQIYGERRQTALDARRERQVNAARSFAAALTLANFQNAPVPGIGYDARQASFEGTLAREGMRSAERIAESTGDAQRDAARTSGGLGILGSLIGLAA